MKKTFFLKRHPDPEHEENFIEIPVKTKYILCFPPREMLAGNFFSQTWRVILWKPCVKHQYAYEPAFAGEREEVRETKERIRVGDIVCVFMGNAPETKKLDFFTRKWTDWKIKKYAGKIEEGGRRNGAFGNTNGEKKENDGKEDKVCDIYRMKYRQDYPYSLRLYFAERFLENLDLGKRTRIGVVEGDTLKRKDLIAMLRNCYDKMNFLTIFSREGAEYRELVEDAWEQYGLAVTVTPSFGELALCDYVLDCTRMPFAENIRCRKGCSFFSVFGDRKKIRSLRRAGGEITFDSCANILDRAFHNKV